MSKVIVTKEQAERIESWSLGNRALLSISNFKDEDNLCLNELTFDELAKCIYIGYEIKVNFKVGDWVVGTNKRVGKIIEVSEIGQIITTEYNNLNTLEWLWSELRYATDEEISKAKAFRMSRKLNAILRDLSSDELTMLKAKLNNE